jgi:predicted nucleic acid-binding protein
VVLHYLNSKELERWPGLIEAVESVITADGGMNISAVTAFEIRRGFEELKRRGRGQRKAIGAELLLRRATIHELDDAVWRIGVDLYAAGKVHTSPITLSDADLLISATAIAKDRILLTTDEKLCRILQALGYSHHVSLP